MAHNDIKKRRRSVATAKAGRKAKAKAGRKAKAKGMGRKSDEAGAWKSKERHQQ
jgi:hypothetical protein